MMSLGIPIVDGILDIIKSGQERGLKEAEIRADLEKTLANYEAQIVAAVNATMQAEAKSEHWAQWLWRPVVGFTFSLVILNNYVLMPYLQSYLRPVAIPDNLWSAMLIILGAAAATRGWQKVEQAKNGKPTSANPAPTGGLSATNGTKPERPRREDR